MGILGNRPMTIPGLPDEWMRQGTPIMDNRTPDEMTTINPYWTQAAPGSGQVPGQEPLAPQGLRMPMQMPAPPAKKGGGISDVLKGILGGALDGVAVHYGFQPGSATRRAEERDKAKLMWQMIAKQQQDQMEREARYADAIKLREYDAAHRPKSEDSFTRTMAMAGITPDMPEYKALARKRAEMLTNPVQLVPDGMGGVQSVRPYGGSGESPPPVIDWPEEGGPTPPASGGFPY